MPKISAALISILLALSCSDKAFTKELEERNWIEVRTPNFSVRGVLKEKETIRLVQHLELFRAMVKVVTSIENPEASIPTHIYAFGGRRDFELFGIGSNAAGVLMPGLRANRILIRDSAGISEASIILHEYVHFLIRSHGSQIYPRWFDEGIAEFLSSTRVSKKYFEIGLPAEHRFSSLRHSTWIPIRKLLTGEAYDTSRSETQAMFYAESWALMHFLQTDPKAPDPFNIRMAKYLSLVESGEDPVEAFEGGFGMTAGNANRRLKRYLEKGRFSYTRLDAKKLLPVFEPEVIKLSSADVTLGLGQLALSRRKYDLAEKWLRMALNGTTTSARAEAGLGDVMSSRQDYESALKHYKTATESAPDDPDVHIDLGKFWQSRARTSDFQEDRIDYLNKARRSYVKAWKLDDSLPENYAQFGRTHLMEGKNFEKAVELLEEAHYLLPSNVAIRLDLAQAYLRTNNNTAAINAVRSVLAWSHGDSPYSKRANRILERATADNDQSETSPVE